MRWGEKRYYSLDYHLKETYGKKLYKIALDGGMSCPNRDGSIGNRGCIFCSEGGSGDFASNRNLSVYDQIESGKLRIAKKDPGQGYIAYFQAFTNTYGPLSHLRKIFFEAIMHPQVEVLSIATRPDCLGPEVLSLLKELRQIKPVWVELGLQTIHPETVSFIRRGYPTSQFHQAVTALREIHIDVIAHIILCLPGETREMMLETIDYVNQEDIQGIKLQLLHVLDHTDLAKHYLESPFWTPTLEEYTELLSECICALRPDIVIHRLTGDGPKEILLAPLWTGQKRKVLNHIHAYLKRQDLWQGRNYNYGRTINPI